jgi:microsomal prostaglandin-E synthase 2
MISRSISMRQFVSIAASISLTETISRKFSTSCEAPLRQPSNLPKITLYQYQICPFCNRVKAYLDYLQIDYDSVEVNPLTKSELSFSKDYKKVPIALFDDQAKRESSEIINYITEKLAKDVPKTFFPDDTEKWSIWSEKRLAVYLYPNITRSYSESWECFSYANSVSTWSRPMQIATQVAGSAAMTLANGKIKKKYNIVDERAELNQELQLWIEAVGNKRFLHGDKISMPDIMVYGVLRSIQGLTTFRELMDQNTALATWYENVDREVKNRKK